MLFTPLPMSVWDKNQHQFCAVNQVAQATVYNSVQNFLRQKACRINTWHTTHSQSLTFELRIGIQLMQCKKGQTAESTSAIVGLYFELAVKSKKKDKLTYLYCSNFQYLSTISLHVNMPFRLFNILLKLSNLILVVSTAQLLPFLTLTVMMKKTFSMRENLGTQSAKAFKH